MLRLAIPGVYAGSVSRVAPAAGRRRGLVLTLALAGAATPTTDVHIPFARIAELMVVLEASALNRLVGQSVELAFDPGNSLAAISGPGGTYRI